jgi:hypothetical protein
MIHDHRRRADQAAQVGRRADAAAVAQQAAAGAGKEL